MHEAKRLAQLYNTDHKCTFINCKSELMPIADASIDIIFSRSTMQYMDYDKVLSEYMRVLKPSGTLAVIENLRYSPLIFIDGIVELAPNRNLISSMLPRFDNT
jgi:ubiquinone/menaquinone biosynthesis C-methylase UbiE